MIIPSILTRGVDIILRKANRTYALLPTVNNNDYDNDNNLLYCERNIYEPLIFSIASCIIKCLFSGTL